MTLTEHPLSICVTDNGEELHLLLEGELDVATTPTLLDCFQAGISWGLPEDVCLDFSSLDYVDSTGLSLLIMMQKRAKANGTKFTIRSPNGQFLDILDATGLTKFFDFDSHASAHRI
jgi:anti-sigma B factor antagonist